MTVFKNLLTTRLERHTDTDVIVSHVDIPPHTELPRHWHPGEEFVYVLQGAVTLKQEGRPDCLFHTGELFVVPLKQIHTVMTRSEGVKVLVFRVHEQGQPERIVVP